MLQLKKAYHVVHLVCDILKPILCAFDSSDHCGKLASNDCLGMEEFTKSLSLGSPSDRWRDKNYLVMSNRMGDILEAFFHNKALTSCGWANHDPAFMVEITVSGSIGWVRWVVGVEKGSDLSMTKIPPPSGPRVFPTGTLTLSKVTNAVPAVGDWKSLVWRTRHGKN